MSPTLVVDVAKILRVVPIRVFGLSFEYAEHPHSRHWIKDRYMEWHYHGKIHPDVEDFILDCLAHRVDPTEICR